MPGSVDRVIFKDLSLCLSLSRERDWSGITAKVDSFQETIISEVVDTSISGMILIK